MERGLISLLILFGTVAAFATTDTKNANYSEAYVDLSVAGPGYDLRVERAYNSRTLFNGIFGFGWCSDFETRLEVQPEGSLKLVQCGAGLDTVYTAKGFSEKNVDQTVHKIMDKVKAENLAASSKYMADLEKKLMDDAALRNEYAIKYSVPRQISDHTKYMAANGNDFIEKDGNEFIHALPDGSVQRFKLNGRLSKMYDHNNNFLTFFYDGKLLKEVTDNFGRKLTFSYQDNGKVRAISGPGDVRAEYKFKNMSDLAWVRNSAGAVYTYEYDDLHNLTRVTFPDRKVREITYNKDKDWVTGVKDIDGCSETYAYKESSDDPKNHYWANVKKVCNGKTIKTAKYEFWFAMKGDHSAKYLKKSHTQENQTVIDVAYNESGKPVTVTRNKKTTKYEYYPDGLLYKKIMAGGGGTTTLHYDNKWRKVSRIEKDKKSTDFTYDNKGSLIKAVSSDGQKIVLSYDTHGRIQTLEDQAHRKIFVKYDDRLNKPVLIEREGVGSITITYNTRGEIAKVHSTAGATVATQVASTLNSLVDLVQPSGVTLNF